MNAVSTARIVDSHTGGEPTRVLVAGGPDLGRGSMAERLQRLREGHDRWRRALVSEPRGSEVLVGALLGEPANEGSACGVIYFDNAGYLGMCGHGTIGLVATLSYLGRISMGTHRIDTPVGTISASLHTDGSVTVANVPAYRHGQGVVIDVPGVGRAQGDVAWGGNWFFFCKDHGLELQPTQVAALTARAQAMRKALVAQGITGANGAEIEHIVLLGPAQNPAHHGRGFVLCPGDAYDRSPCGTGTSARLACLAADGALAPGATWYQESVIGSVFGARYEPAPNDRGMILPFIHGRAHVTLDATLVFDTDDPFAWGMV